MQVNFDQLRQHAGEHLFAAHYVDDEGDFVEFFTTLDEACDYLMELFEQFRDEYADATVKVHKAVATRGCFEYHGYFGDFCGNADEYECLMQENEDLHDCDYLYTD